MASRWQLGLMGLTAIAGLGLQACVAVPVRDRPAHARPAYGYGGSGVVEVNPGAARDECVHAARDFKGYRGVRAGAVDVRSPEHAEVQLQVNHLGPLGGRAWITCAYDARTGRAYVP